MNILNAASFDDLGPLQIPQPMSQGKAGGWGQTYFWVQLPITEDDIGDTQKFNEAHEYAKEVFGKEGSKWFIKNRRFFFNNEKDLTLFILRWAS